MFWTQRYVRLLLILISIDFTELSKCGGSCLLVRLPLCELLCLWYICSATQWESVSQGWIIKCVWWEYRVFFWQDVRSYSHLCRVEPPATGERPMERGDHDACWCMDVCHQSLTEVSSVDIPPVRSSHSHLVQWHVTLFPFVSKSALTCDLCLITYEPLLWKQTIRVGANSATIGWVEGTLWSWFVSCFTDLFWENLHWIWMNIFLQKLFSFCLKAAIKDGCTVCVQGFRIQIGGSRNSTLVGPELSLATDLWNPLWLRHQSDILELLFLASAASQAGLMNELILMPCGTDGHSWLPTEDSHSCNLGEPIRIHRKYLFHCLTKIKTEIFLLRFPLISHFTNLPTRIFVFLPLMSTSGSSVTIACKSAHNWMASLALGFGFY